MGNDNGSRYWYGIHVRALRATAAQIYRRYYDAGFIDSIEAAIFDSDNTVTIERMQNGQVVADTWQWQPSGGEPNPDGSAHHEWTRTEEAVPVEDDSPPISGVLSQSE